MSPAEEQPLTGGNVSAGVVRVGDTVRRPAGPWTPAVHALLGHLHAVGFRGAPRALGLDDQGREVLDFVPGEVVWPDRFALVRPRDRLADVARLVREFHDAVRDFTPPPDACWQVLIPDEGEGTGDGEDGGGDGDGEGGGIIAHHDLAPWNLVAGRDGRFTFIDWDVAAPGSRLWDVAYALHGFVPLRTDPAWRPADAGERLRVFADAYGLDEAERRRLVPLLGRRARSMHDFLRDRAGRGEQPWARLWAEGHGDTWRGDAEYIEEREAHWERALLDG
ncbi:phosphotransferase [Streptomyces sp. CBMA123]|uniref:phosphotransferase n=1 Tax=Streptomyces sp. CBMA123 TaxID=1896313 RepID=UPI0016620A5E|nr:phosphotransferase [Streptomyces sp. CBMA123]MBD0690804.1 kinase [Streptomyces sp. CBMA123]